MIAAPPGPLVVIAGAGAGKTETMAARVVWLVANGYARPGEVLGLTFTRKAAGQLLRRVRTRLARLAGAGLVPGGPDIADMADDPATVSTYHAFAGNLLREHGLLLPVEPDTRLLGETELWQLAFRVVCEHPEHLDTDKTPAAVTAMVLRLAGQLAEHLVDTDTTARHPRRAGTAGAHAAGRPVSARPRAQPVAAAHAGHPDRTHRAGSADRRAARAHAGREGHGLRHADGLGRPAGVDVPASRRAVAAAVPGGAARRVPGHRARAARRAVVAVRRRRRRRPGPDRRRRSDPVDLRLAGRVGDQPAAVHHRFPAVGRNPCAHAGAAHQLAQPAAGAASGERGVRRGAAPFGRGAGTAAAARRPAGRHPVRAADRRGDRTGLGGRPFGEDAITAPAARVLPHRRRRCWCAATPMPRRWPTRLRHAASLSRSSASPGCSPCPRLPTWWRRCVWWPIPPQEPPRCGC